MSFVERIDEFHAQAQQITGFDDFGPTDYRESLQLLLRDYDRYNRFLPLGEELLAGDVIGRLCGRLRAHAGFKRFPAYANAQIERPLIVVGMARSGTTALFRLLAHDPQWQSMPLWLAASPMPRPPVDEWAANPLFQRAQLGVERVYSLVPEFRQIHPVAADLADECRVVTEHCFWGGGIGSMGTLPNFIDWCLHGAPSYVYRYHRQVLGLIAGGDTRTWLLKCPIHIWGLDALLTTYPDARIVYSHRPAIESLSSTASMVYLLRRIRQRDITPEKIGQEILHNWGRALASVEQVRRAHPAANILDVSLRDTQNDPLGTVERIYRHFGIELTDTTRATMANYVARDPRGGHGGHHYTPDYFGLSEAAVEQSVGDYWQRNRAVCVG